MGSVVAAPRLSCPVACGIPPRLGTELASPVWQAGSLPLSHLKHPEWDCSPYKRAPLAFPHMRVREKTEGKRKGSGPLLDTESVSRHLVLEFLSLENCQK